MRLLPILALLMLASCSVPVANRWQLNVEPGQVDHPGEVLTWGYAPRPVEPDILMQVEELYERDLAEIAKRREGAMPVPQFKNCAPGETMIFQRDDYTEYSTDRTFEEIVYQGCGPDSGEVEYWRTICVKDEEVQALTDSRCFREARPAVMHCRFGRLAFVPSWKKFACLEEDEISDKMRGVCPGEFGALRVGDGFWGTCLKLREIVFREPVHKALFIK